MSGLRRLFLAAGLIAVAFPAVSAELDIPGKYGNEDGCRKAETGIAESDDILLLTPSDVSTYAIFCSFVQIYPSDGDGQVAIVTCGHEGEAEITLGLLRVQQSQDGEDAYLIFDETGTSWGKAGRCR